MKSRFPIIALVMIAMSMSPTVSHADADNEREGLAKISAEIERLERIVANTSKAADSSARIKFRYDWLERDLALIKDGIDNHLDAPRQPRPVPPLKGEYRR
jgi:RAQPRD family integrative conjugative element protein